MVSVSPVPDYDRLLSLDSALGQIPGITSVSLIDSAEEEVAFRIEADQPLSIESLRASLSSQTKSQIEISSSADDTLALRLAS